MVTYNMILIVRVGTGDIVKVMLRNYVSCFYYDFKIFVFIYFLSYASMVHGS
jgi:hypothetical protein